MATNNADFKVKKGLIVTEGITLGGHTFNDIDIGTEFVDTDDHIMSSGAIREKIESYSYGTGDATLAGTQTFSGAKTFSSAIELNDDLHINDSHGRIEFKRNASNTATNAAITFNDNADALKARILYQYSTNQMQFYVNSENQLLLNDGVLSPATDNNVDLGTSSLKFKDSFFGLVDAENFKINGGQGSDGQVLTSTGSGVAWEDAGGGGASAIGDLSDVLMDATNFTDGFLLQPNSDGSAPTTGILSSAIENIGIGKNALSSLTSGDYNIAIGSDALSSQTTASRSVAIGLGALNDANASNAVAIGQYALRYATKNSNVAVGYAAGQGVSSGDANSTNFERATFLGYQAGQKGAKTGQTWVTALGYNAGSGDVIGAYSTYVGGRAGYLSGEGQSNTAIGFYAMHGNSATTTGFQNNTAIGANSMYCTSASTASNNVTVGSLTGYALTTGDANTLIGYSAGWRMTSGTQNVAVGFDALGDVTTGVRNIGIGYNAANNFDTESDNIAIGYDALGSNSLAGAEQNVSIGNYSGDAISEGDGNTIIGHLSGGAVTSGSRNITLGWTAGNNITTGDNNVVIGAADVPSATGDDQLSISSGDGGTTWIQGNSDGIVLGALTPLFYERAALDTNAVDFRVPTVQSSTANPNGYPMPFAGTVRAASFLFAGSAISTSGNTNTIRIRKNGGTSGSDIKDFTFTESDLVNTNGNQYSLVKSGSDVLFTFAAGDVLQVKRQSGSTDLNNSQAMLWVSYNF
jgi:hypothetical protein